MAKRDEIDDLSTGPGPYIGRALPRLEDKRFITGLGRYTDDFRMLGETHAVFVRSHHAHAQILKIDIKQASAAPGVLAVLTGADYVSDGCGPISDHPNPADALDHQLRVFRADVFEDAHLPMPIERAMYVGEPIAVVIAEGRALAEDASNLVKVDYQPLRPVVDIRGALEPSAPQLIPGRISNIAVEQEFGDRQSVEMALATAHLVVDRTLPIQRLANAQMEPRSTLARFDPATGKYEIIAGSQGALRQRDALAASLRVPPDSIRVVSPDVGGGFGPRSALSAEQPIVAWASRRIGRPVRWTASRTESFLADYQGRDSIARGLLGFSQEGRIVAYRVELAGNVGAYPISFVPLANFYRVMTGVYDLPTVHIAIRGVLTNTVPTAPYRGAGRPEATYVLERLIDIAARRLGMDRIQLREFNIVKRAQIPYRNAMGLTYDSGDFLGNMRRAVTVADWNGASDRKKMAQARGRFLGIGVANYVEAPVGMPHERVDVRVDPSGFVEVVAGTQSTGQGHETTFAQVMADRLGVSPDQVRLVTGDTEVVRSGGGTHSDRSMRLAGALMVECSATIIEAARSIAAQALKCGINDVEFSDGLFRAQGSNLGLSIFDVARALESNTDTRDGRPAPLASSASFTGRLPAIPTGAAVCEVEIEPATGETKITSYATVDDVGQPINPAILHGQVHGGIAQGAGQALWECVVRNQEDGQILSGSFLDYCMPRADNLPRFQVELTEDPTSGNPLRVKGGGESGITPAMAATMNAICDAVADLGIEDVSMPATSYRLWHAMKTKERS